MMKEFYWRSDILPPGPVTCNTGIRPFPPTIVPLQNISNIDINNNTDEVSFLMEWTPPEFPNGELDIYQVCIRFTDVVLDGMEDCESVIEISIPEPHRSRPTFTDVWPCFNTRITIDHTGVYIE